MMNQQHLNETETATLSFGDAKVTRPDLSTFVWPDYEVASGLLHIYFEFASPTYRYVHEPTMRLCLSNIYSQADVTKAAQALILLMFASASVFTVNSFGDTVDASHEGWKTSELYFTKAESLLAEETGPPRLESVQARFAAVQYMLSSSRPNRALFAFGTMIQLLQAVGIHRRRSEKATSVSHNTITIECHKRLFWCAFTMDKYLSIIMGRMPLLHIDDSNQALPTAANDEDITEAGIRPQNPMLARDCLQHATIAHVKIGIILARASQEQHRLPSTAGISHVEAAVRRSEEIADWHSTLTPILSGAIHSSSLVPCFRRQHSVLTLARLHAIMFVTRPLLLRDLTSELPTVETLQYREQLCSCVQAAKDAVEMINGSMRYKVLYPGFWYSQYIAFNAISIIHIYILQLSKRRIPDDLFLSDSQMSSNKLFELALAGQVHLAEAGTKSAPVWRYSPILEGLSAETGRYIASQTSGNQQTAPRATMVYPSLNSDVHGVSGRSDQPPRRIEQNNTHNAGVIDDSFAMPSLELDNAWLNGHESLFDDLIAENLDNNLTMDFWPQFDNLPIGTYVESPNSSLLTRFQALGSNEMHL